VIDVLAALGLALAPVVTPPLPAALLPYRADLQRHAQFYFGIPGPLAVLAAQMAQESDFNPSARSRVGAAGLYQFMPATAMWAGEQLGLPAAPLNPAWAIRAGVWYDKWLMERVNYQRDCDKWGATLSSFNGGLGWQYKRQLRAKDPLDFWGSVRLINPGITAANQRENQDYPKRIVYERQAQFRALGGRLVCIT